MDKTKRTAEGERIKEVRKMTMKWMEHEQKRTIAKDRACGKAGQTQAGEAAVANVRAD
jgi:hypothetical protein